MADPNKNVTPAMRQFHEWKARYPDCILFFRVGDFYEMFFEDALIASKALEIALTKRSKDDEAPPMCGVPHHASQIYINRLITQGFKVAVCDQTSQAVPGKIVSREVTQVVTPGIVFDQEGLDAKNNNYLMAISLGKERIGVAYSDATTGEFWATELKGPRAALKGSKLPHALVDEMARVNPKEVLYLKGKLPFEKELQERFGQSFYSPVEEFRFNPTASKEALAKVFPNFDYAAFTTIPVAFDATALVAAYMSDTIISKSGESKLGHLRAPQIYGHSEHMVLDEYALAHLEIAKTLVDRSRRGSLLGTVDLTSTSMGGRLLNRWFTAPLMDGAAIIRRQDAIEELVLDLTVRGALAEMLAGAYDLERLNGKVATGVAGPRDLMALRATLEKIPTIVKALSTRTAPALVNLANLLSVKALGDVVGELSKALVDDPPATLKDGGVIRPGYSKELDELNTLSREGKNILAQIQAREQKRTGINSLKINFNRVFGYYIEITRANLERVPKDYERRQTTANGERFVTPELKEYESKILTADEKKLALEQQLFSELRARLAQACTEMGRAAQALAELDCYTALAEAAHRYNYVRPTVGKTLNVDIKEGRHPVVERLVSAGAYVPNDILMDPANAQLLIITGPNMAGKSTIMRQVALICLLAQTGSFVPAKAANLPLLDRIFTRVGAADNLARGASTFMVEMWETKNILENATPKSLLLLDELGRGTSTFDGLSLAWSVAEHIHDRIGALTMFATHYHELTDLAQVKSKVKNFHIAVREWEDQIIFLRKLLPGGANRSYGIHVAQLAGLPDTVITRAKEILKNLEAHELDVDGQPALTRAKKKYKAQEDRRQFALFSPGEPPKPSPAMEELARVTPDAMTPIEALTTLAKLKAMLDKEE
jgi:DNA mismatch repair protein MutS